MNRIALIVFVLFGCTQDNNGPRGDYLALLRNGDHQSIRLYLRFTDAKPELMVIGFRGYPVPIIDIPSQGDSVTFRREDQPASFKGVYDPERNEIKGAWLEDDLSTHLMFRPVLPDTIKGLFPRQTKTYSYDAPPELDDGLHVAELTTEGMNKRLIDSLVSDIIKMKFDYVHSIIIARNNKLVLEEYFFGYTRDAHFGIQSVTKSFVSALTGIAIEKGELPGLNAPLCNYLPQYRSLICNEQNKSITLSHVMSMTTGLAWDEMTYEYGHEQNSANIASATGDEYKYLFTRPRMSKTVFAYNSLNHIVMNHVLQEATGLSNREELERRLIQPLGITQYDLGADDAGILGDIFLRPRDMLKFGLLYLNDGHWQGEQLLSKRWVAQSTSTQVNVKDGLGYGYFWWTRKFPLNGETVSYYFAWGYGGQYIFVIPTLNVVVVFNGTNWSTDPAGNYLQIIEQYIIPACLPREHYRK